MFNVDEIDTCWKNKNASFVGISDHYFFFFSSIKNANILINLSRLF